jgi:hypothetical protein
MSPRSAIGARLRWSPDLVSALAPLERYEAGTLAREDVISPATSDVPAIS